jgi:hypothetical protein
VSRQIENLTKLRVRDLIADAEFVRERETLQHERSRLAQRLSADERPDDWIEPARMLALFSHRAVSWFSGGNLEVKRLVVSVAGLNPTLAGRQLNIDAKKPFVRRTNTTRIPLGWSLVKDVRTRWRAHDADLVTTIDALRHLLELVQSRDQTRAA